MSWKTEAHAVWEGEITEGEAGERQDEGVQKLQVFHAADCPNSSPIQPSHSRYALLILLTF